MNQNIVNIIFFILIIYLFNINFTEKMSNTDIKKIIMKEYMIDVDAGRNLSKLANDLTLNNKLVVPGGLEIAGPLKIGNVNIKQNGEIHGKSINVTTVTAGTGGITSGSSVIKYNGEIKGKSINVNTVTSSTVTSSTVTSGTVTSGTVTAGTGGIKSGSSVIKYNGEIHGSDFHGRSFNGQAGSYVRYGDDFVLSTNSAGTPGGKHYIIYDDNNNVRKNGSGSYGYSNIPNQGYQIHRARNRR